MTFAPLTIIAAMKVMTYHGYANGGIVGDAAHAATGVSYHLGKSQLTATAYSRVTPRDKAGLTEAASAFDISRGSFPASGLQAWSRWLVTQVVAQAPGTRDIREVIYSPDGKTVRRYDNYQRKSFLGGDGTGQGDNSHLWHTHVSWYRDSEFRDKTALLETYFPSAPPVIGDTVNSYPVPKVPSQVMVATNDVLWPNDICAAADPARTIVSPGRNMPFLGTVNGKDIVEYVSDTGVHSGLTKFAPTGTLGAVTAIPLTTDDGFTKATQDAAVASQKAADAVACKSAMDAHLVGDAAALAGDKAAGKAEGIASEKSRLRVFLGL